MLRHNTNKKIAEAILRIIKIFSTIILSVIISGCVVLTPTESQDSTPDKQFGYIGISAQAKAKAGYAIYIKNTETDNEYVLQLNKPLIFKFGPVGDGEMPVQVNVIKVPPGNYVLSRWATFSWAFSERIVNKKFDEGSLLTTPFTVKPGTVVFLGEFATSDYSEFTAPFTTTLHYQLEPKVISIESARETLVSAYPAFKNVNFSCSFCSFDDTTGHLKYDFLNRDEPKKYWTPYGTY